MQAHYYFGMTQTQYFTDSTLSHYERFRQYHRQTVRNSICNDMAEISVPDAKSVSVNLLHGIRDILVKNFLQHSRLYWWDGNVRIYSNYM